jgi:Domain of Unknown Function (DUF1080)
MLLLSRCLVLAVAFACLPRLSAAADPPVRLFNGKDLAGWRGFLVAPGVRMEEVWSVKDGLLVCRGEPLGFLRTDRTFTSFRLVVEWRWAPGTVVTPGRVPNSGVLMRINGEPKGVPRAIEAQLKSGNAGDLYGFWGMRIEGDRARMKRRDADPALGDMTGVSRVADLERPVGEWNRYEIVLEGRRITVHVNGTKANEADVADVIPGPIGLQSEGGEIHFRTVELTPLP